MVAIASAFRYASIDDIFEKAEQSNEDPLIVVLDGITDPHNVGAMIRSAECAGAHGVILPNRRAAGLTPAAVKASSGAVEHLPVARVVNISKCLETLKARGLWIAAADTSGEPYASADLTGPLALVVGSEGGGISRLVLSGCDRRVALPLHGKIDSLNASVACGILLYEIRRQRG
jgi:23S rRNA (guanosine2251-2'-O)-methyltransferase